MISPENVEAAKAVLADCCGRERPDLPHLAQLLGLPAPPIAYKTSTGAAVYPSTGVQSFSIYALDKFGYPWTPSMDRPSDTLSRLLDKIAGRE